MHCGILIDIPLCYSVIDFAGVIYRVQESSRKLEADKSESKRRCDELGQKLAQSDNLAQQAQNRATEAERNAKNLQDQLKSQLLDTQQQIQV